MEYLKIKNWSKWQTYRSDRGQPPWIKLHRCLMRNPEWVALSDAERGQLVGIWLLAADHNGAIPASTDLIQKLCYLETKPNINKFIELGFICQNGVDVASRRRQDDQPKAETETETDTDTKKNNALFCQKDFDKFWLLYPIKREKKDVLVLWKKMLKSNKLPKVDILITAIQNQTEWRKNTTGEFRPDWKYPIRWLKKQCWEDEITQEPEIEAPKATQAGDPWVYDN